MNVSQKLQSYFNIREGESEIVLLMMIYSAAIGIAINYYFTASSSLFLAQFPIETLPYTILLASIALMITQVGYKYVESRVSPNRLGWLSLVVVGIIVFMIRIGLEITDAGWLIIAVIVLFRVMIILLIVGFWILANRLFTLTQSKRLFALIGAGDVISIMIASFILPTVVGLIGTVNLFVIVLGSVLVCLGCQLFIQRRYHYKLTDSNPKNNTDVPQENVSGRKLMREQYIVLLFATYLLAWGINYALDYAFLGQLQSRFEGNPEAVAGFIGIVFGFIHLTNFFLKFFISGRLIIRYGLSFGILALPLTLLTGIILAGGVGTTIGTGALFFWIIVVTKYAEEVFREAFNEPVTRIFYQILPDNIQSVALAFVEGTGYALTALIAGGVLVFFTITNTYTPLRIVYLMIVLILVWIFTVRRLSGNYPVLLRRALQKRAIDRDVEIFQNPDSLQLLTAKLQSTRADEVIYAFKLLEQNAPETLQAYLPDLLVYPSSDVQLYTLRYIEQNQPDVDMSSQLLMLRTEAVNPTIREAALLAHHALKTDTIHLNGHLTDPDAVVRRGSVISVLKYGDSDTVRQVQNWLDQIVQSETAGDRRLAAQIFTQVDARPYEKHLLTLLQDDDLTVRREAIKAVGSLHSREIWDAVAQAIRLPALRSIALDAISSGGISSLKSLAHSLHEEPDISAQVWLIRGIGRIDDPRAVDNLASKIDWQYRLPRTHVLRALHKSAYHTTDANLIHKQIEREQAEAQLLVTCLYHFAEHELLYEALREAFRLAQERILLLLSFYYDLNHVPQNFFNGTEKQREYAVEVLNLTLPQQLRSKMMLLLEDMSIEQRFKLLSTPTETPDMLLENIVRDTTQLAWLRVVSFDKTDISQIPMELETMYSIIERVIILKTISIFSNLPDYVLAHLANHLKEMTIAAGETIIQKGDMGDAMYIIVTGKVRAHDEGVFLNYIDERGVFGEMAVLDPEPRMASITAEEETHVFQLEQDALYEVMADYPEISRAVIHVILGYLRNRINDLTDLRKQLTGDHRA